ncbi:putative pathogenesis-related protein [Arabidopsis thaliana]|uniref:CAP (Cysteine-rich secretory proteins, Antigen 5, and Pathogenesis-related 1 protein) superfamily protein n=2 Tax=Arabidopsis thaliana TaxID=3702 RepID=Q9SW05_ARATH|nr:CAP (Cysteine-rich secretory proteins, Antigen 5, and Pathogenesis-related 1 protein) superfamily protein [Arabidopsis thaliana]AEE85113.1 CAP (Cysteine-rich secretory proteins, Antigen 5, and Pathogenesis-related 1 protein) superfamily protein [Arabidopsis thaliana]CAB39599.1 putative pathogenesis-related protein [Arabidopsis thaliana]CAB79433.1 putative pathogenesis-related protein [Arabidopsis thaliana]VYS63911.1 unnamed protein product [Arabidopsis thaliana]BAC42068.1 putative pathogene|eukprot:NP_194308.1 CAP (Cysteine-rich secretory proteins, Antigen 5, and Pathogenesis-related 1 protein) superfamily protein [Arabidopsis thaliana]
MSSSYLRVILLLGALNVVVSLSITNSLITKSATLGQVFRICKNLCPGCDHDSLQFLFRHNLVRAARFEPPLIWDRRLQNYAQGWANQRRGDCALRHSVSNGEFNLGENIYWGYGANWSPADAVVAWASEKRFYHYGSNTCDAGQMCGHYTQIVWKSTRRVGCARVVCDNGGIFMTCNYDPPGNYIGQKPY